MGLCKAKRPCERFTDLPVGPLSCSMYVKDRVFVLKLTIINLFNLMI